MSPSADEVIDMEVEDAIAGAPDEDGRRALLHNANERRIADLSQRMALERIHEEAEWKERAETGRVDVRELVADLARAHRRRDDERIKVETLQMSLHEAHEDLAYRALQTEEHLARINELTNRLKEHGIKVPRKQFQPMKGLNYAKRAEHQGKRNKG